MYILTNYDIRLRLSVVRCDFSAEFNVFHEKEVLASSEKLAYFFHLGKWSRPKKNYILSDRAGEPANFLTAPAPDFFFKRLRLLIFDFV